MHFLWIWWSVMALNSVINIKLWSIKKNRLAMLYISKPVSIFFIFILFCLLAAFYIFDGCILTILEKNLCGDTFTFIDPFLEYYDLDLNTKNRYNMSIKVALYYIAITLFIFIYRNE